MTDNSVNIDIVLIERIQPQKKIYRQNWLEFVNLKKILNWYLINNTVANKKKKALGYYLKILPKFGSLSIDLYHLIYKVKLIMYYLLPIQKYSFKKIYFLQNKGSYKG